MGRLEDSTNVVRLKIVDVGFGLDSGLNQRIYLLQSNNILSILQFTPIFSSEAHTREVWSSGRAVPARDVARRALPCAEEERRAGRDVSSRLDIEAQTR
jgi:hypothetical protein